MPLYKDGKKVSAVFRNSKAIQRIYRGASLVWGAIKETLAHISGKTMTLVDCTREEPLRDFRLYGRSEQQKYLGTNIARVKSYNEVWNSMPYPYTMARDGLVTLELIDTSVNKTFYMRYLTHNHPFSTVAREMDADGKFIRSTFLGLGNEVDANQTCTGTFTVGADCKLLAISLFTNRAEWAVKVDESNLSDLQINIGSAKSYEPYVGGIPSPSSDYPQEINSIINPIVKFSGANLVADIEHYGYFYNDAGELTYIGWVNTTKIVPIKETPYIYCVGDDLHVYTIRINYFDADMKFISRSVQGPGGAWNRFNVPNGAKYICFSIDNNAVWTMAAYDKFPFEPYSEPQSYQWNHTLYGVKVTYNWDYYSDGNGWIGDWVDIENKRIVRNVKHSVFTIPTIKAVSTSGDHRYVFFCSNVTGIPTFSKASDMRTNNVLCRNIYPKVGVGGEENIYRSWNGIILAVEDGLSLAEIKEKYEGMEVEIVANSPTTYEPLTDAEVEAFKRMKTFKPTTIVTNNYDAHMETSYHTKLDAMDAQLTSLYNNDLKEITQ